MDNSQLLTAKHGFVVGVEGAGKSTFVRNLLKNNAPKSIYITVHNEDFGNDLCVSINEPLDELKDNAIAKIHELLAQDKSFIVKVDYGYTGQMKGVEYLNDVLNEILDNNKDFILAIDDVQSIVQGAFQITYKKLLQQKTFPVISVAHHIDDESKYVFEYAKKTYIFKLSPTNFEVFEERGLLSKRDMSVFEQKVGEFIVR